MLLSWLDERPDVAAKDLFLRLQQELPDTFPDGQLRTLQRRVKQWRQEMAGASSSALRRSYACEDDTPS